MRFIKHWVNAFYMRFSARKTWARRLKVQPYIAVLPGCMVLSPVVSNICQIRKIQRFDKSDADISNLIIECSDESCQKFYFTQLISQWYTFHFALFSLREPPKLTKLTNLMIFKILHSYFRFDRTLFWLKLIMLQMLFTTTLNIMTNSRRYTIFSVGASKVDQKNNFFFKIRVFLLIGQIWGFLLQRIEYQKLFYSQQHLQI